MFESIAPYGPDLSEAWIGDGAAFGRHLLRIAPQAVHDHLGEPSDDLIVVADAILDNREELASQLGMRLARLPEMSDTGLIRKAFLQWGPDCAHRLIGDYAFAAIQPLRRRVFLFRDHIGARPLYWSLRGETFLFSSAIQGIVGFEEFKWTIDQRVIAEYLFNPHFPVSKPFFEQVNKVPAGAYVELNEANARVTRWWNPSTNPVRTYKSDADAVAACREILERAVADRIRTEAEIGTHFSGGIDSTGVAVLAARKLRSRGRQLAGAYAWSPPLSEQYPAEHPRDERALIRSVADREEVPVRFGSADGANFLDFIRRPFELEGEADLADELPVIKASREDNLQVMLSGWGGDEAFSAHAIGYLANLVGSGKFDRARRFAHYYHRSLKRPSTLSSLVWRELVHPLLPGALYRRLSPYRSYVRSGSFISAELSQSHVDLWATRHTNIKFGPDPNANLKRHVTAGHISMRMESWAAWAAPFGFQYRYPLTDRRLLEFLFTLPADQLFMNYQPRGLARAVLADCLPSSASKHDYANEALRRATRGAAWETIRQHALDGAYHDECPWLDKPAFLEEAEQPKDQSAIPNIIRFGEVYAAARVWALYRRAAKNNWL